MLGVLYPYAHIVPYAIGKQCSYIIYNTLWRGLAELLISLGRQCEGLVGGISEEVSPTSFLYPLVKYDWGHIGRRGIVDRLCCFL